MQAATEHRCTHDPLRGFGRVGIDAAARMRPTGSTICARQNRTKKLPPTRKSQSTLSIDQDFAPSNDSLAEPGNMLVPTTNRIISRLEVTNTGLWMSIPWAGCCPDRPYSQCHGDSARCSAFLSVYRSGAVMRETGAVAPMCRTPGNQHHVAGPSARPR